MNNNFSVGNGLVPIMANNLSLGVFGFMNYSIIIIVSLIVGLIKVIILSLVLGLIKVSKSYKTNLYLMTLVAVISYLKIKTLSTNYYESPEDKFLMEVLVVLEYLLIMQEEQKVENLKFEYPGNKQLAINTAAVAVYLKKTLISFILNSRGVGLLKADKKSYNAIYVLFFYILVLTLTSDTVETDNDFLLNEFKRLYKSLKKVNGLFCIYTPNRRAMNYIKKKCRDLKGDESIARNSLAYPIFMPKAVYLLGKIIENNTKTLADINEHLVKQKSANGLLTKPKIFELLTAEEFYLKLLRCLKKSLVLTDLNKLSCKRLLCEYTDILYFLPEKSIVDLFYANHHQWNMEIMPYLIFAFYEFSLIKLIQIQIYLFNGIMVYPMIDYDYVKNNTGKQFYRCVFNLNEILRDEDYHGRQVFRELLGYDKFKRRGKEKVYGYLPHERTTGNYYVLHVIYMALFIEEEVSKQRHNPTTRLWFEVYIHHLKTLLTYFSIESIQINIIFYKNLPEASREQYKRFIRTYLKEYDETF